MGVIAALTVANAVSGFGQLTLECTVTRMRSPGLMEELVNTESGTATGIPFTHQLKVGAAPPFVVCALKVTGVPWQGGGAVCVMFMVGVFNGFMVTVTWSMAESGWTHPVAVILTFTTSPFTRELVTK